MKPPKAFVCHSSANKDIAERFASDLRSRGVDAWFDKWEIAPGDSLRRKIEEGILEAGFFTALITSESLKSEWVQTELDAATIRKIQGTCKIIPVLLGMRTGELPLLLQDLKNVKLDDYDTGLKEIVDVCHGRSIRPPIGEATHSVETGGKSVSEDIALLVTKADEFRKNRLESIRNNETPVALDSNTRAVLHLIPVRAMTGEPDFKLDSLMGSWEPLRPMAVGGWDRPKPSIDGFSVPSWNLNGKNANSYVQVFRNGAIEAVSTRLLRSDKKWIASIYYEKELIESLANYIEYFNDVDINPPVFMMLSFLFVKGFIMYVSNIYNAFYDLIPIDRDDLVFPVVPINDFETPSQLILRPIFDMVWQACGLTNSWNYDERGNWTEKRAY